MTPIYSHSSEQILKTSEGCILYDAPYIKLHDTENITSIKISIHSKINKQDELLNLVVPPGAGTSGAALVVSVILYFFRKYSVAIIVFYYIYTLDYDQQLFYSGASVLS